MSNRILFQRVSRRALFALIAHNVAFIAAYWLAFAFRFDFDIPTSELTGFFLTLPAVLCVKSMIFYAGSHCHRSWHYVSFSDLAALLRSATISTLILVAINYMMVQNYRVPRGVFLLDWAMCILFLGGMRAVARLLREELLPRLNRSGFRKALIVGANQSGETLARHLMGDPSLRYSVAGFLDERVSHQGATIGGVPILGHPSQAIRIAAAVGAQHILVISGVLAGPQLRSLMEDCVQAGCELKVIPGLDDLLTSNFTVRMRDVDINDLLRREPVELNSGEINRLIAGRTVIVTGAGGSIGSEICRQVLKFHPRTLVLLERAENALFLVEQEFRRANLETELIPCIADINDAVRMEFIFATYRPDVVFHAAAHKHVPLMEYNPGEAIKNNVLGTRLIAELADEYGVGEFVMISTDKAVNPTSIMGVSKQLAERFVHALSEVATTKYVVVRFGNVLASNGSVVPIFQEQIRRGGPITVTHPEIERFFMTIPEASQLVLQAATMGKGGEIFVLDMGEPVRIVDLAKDLIRLSGLQPEEIEIAFTGLRPGEKLYEELYFEDEEMQPTPHPKVFAAYHRPYTLSEVRQAIDDLRAHLSGPDDALRRQIKMVVPEYSNMIITNEDGEPQILKPKRFAGPREPSSPLRDAL